MKLGIITHYYKSQNYGGLLQSYALPTFFNKFIDGETKQICYQYTSPLKEFGIKTPDNKKMFLWGILNRARIQIRKFKRYGLIGKKNLENRASIFHEFGKNIPHTDDVYDNLDKVLELNQEFDVFITGSDQIWNPNWFYEPFYLSFVKKDKLKISYAASMAVNQLTKEQIEVMMPLIAAFDYVSVREKTAKEIIESHIEKEVTVVCDPVMLLTSDEWNKIAKSPLYNRAYIYTYLLGGRKINRDITTAIAEKIGGDLATVPYIHGHYKAYDKTFGDIRLNDVGPSEFIGLIRDSQSVVTDSFHAVVFSIIFHKKFFVLLRNKEDELGAMNSRVRDILEELGLSDRIVTDPSQLTEDFLVKDIDYNVVDVALKERRITSVNFLKTAFSGTELEKTLGNYLLTLNN